MKKLIGILVLFVAMSTVNLNANTKSVGGVTNCEAAANAAEVATCGYVGCNFELWDTVFAACNGWEIIY